MANVNNIFPFGTGAGANVMPSASWQTTAARLTGFEAGLAQSIQVNTAVRQAAFVATMIAQFTADYGNANVLDDGNVAAFEANFEAALQQFITALLPSSIIYYGADTGAVNAMVATVTPTLTTLTTGDIFEITPTYANTSATVTLALAATGAKSVVRADGTPLVPGDIQAAPFKAVFGYDAAVGKYLLINPAMWKTFATILGVQGNAYTSGDDGGTATALLAAISPPPAAYVKYQQYQVKLANAIGANPTIAFNTLAAVSAQVRGRNGDSGRRLSGRRDPQHDL